MVPKGIEKSVKKLVENYKYRVKRCLEGGWVEISHNYFEQFLEDLKRLFTLLVFLRAESDDVQKLLKLKLKREKSNKTKSQDAQEAPQKNEVPGGENQSSTDTPFRQFDKKVFNGQLAQIALKENLNNTGEINYGTLQKECLFKVLVNQVEFLFEQAKKLKDDYGSFQYLVDPHSYSEQETTYEELLEQLNQSIQSAETRVNSIRQKFADLEKTINEFTGATNAYIGGRHNKARTRVRQRIAVLQGTIQILGNAKDKKDKFLGCVQKCSQNLQSYSEKVQAAQKMSLPAGWTQVKVEEIFTKHRQAIQHLYCLQNSVKESIEPLSPQKYSTIKIDRCFLTKTGVFLIYPLDQEQGPYLENEKFFADKDGRSLFTNEELKKLNIIDAEGCKEDKRTLKSVSESLPANQVCNYLALCATYHHVYNKNGTWLTNLKVGYPITFGKSNDLAPTENNIAQLIADIHQKKINT